MALAADLGGPTSHTAILGAGVRPPAVIGLGDVARSVRVGEIVIVDGDRGEIVVDPDSTRLVEARAQHDVWVVARGRLGRDAATSPPSRWTASRSSLRANVEFPDEAARRHALRRARDRAVPLGVPLRRPSAAASRRRGPLPDLPRLWRQRVAPHPVVVRTLDLGGEKYFHEVLDRAETNPVLGLRGLRLCLKRPEIFVPQLRALLRASAHANLRVLLPLVTSVDEVGRSAASSPAKPRQLRAAGVLCRPDVPLGAMIETPAAAMTADLLAREVDFLSLGTNDLIQYALAVDRGNPSVAALYEPLHPGVLRMLRFVVRAGKAAGIPVSLCGEMAAVPDLIPTLLGLGLRELSCPPRAVPRVRDAIRATEIAARRARHRGEAGMSAHQSRQALGFRAALRPDRPLRGQGPVHQGRIAAQPPVPREERRGVLRPERHARARSGPRRGSRPSSA